MKKKDEFTVVLVKTTLVPLRPKMEASVSAVGRHPRDAKGSPRRETLVQIRSNWEASVSAVGRPSHVAKGSPRGETLVQNMSSGGVSAGHTILTPRFVKGSTMMIPPVQTGRSLVVSVEDMGVGVVNAPAGDNKRDAANVTPVVTG